MPVKVARISPELAGKTLISVRIPTGASLEDQEKCALEEIGKVMQRPPYNMYKIVPVGVEEGQLPSFNLVHLNEQFHGKKFDVWDLTVSITNEDDEWDRLIITL